MAYMAVQGGKLLVRITNQWQNQVRIPLATALQAGNEVLQRTQSWAGKGVEIQNPSTFWLTISLLSPSSHTELWAFLRTRYKAFSTITGIILFAVDYKIGALPLSFGTPSQCILSNWAWNENLDKSRPCPIPVQPWQVAATKAIVSLQQLWTFRITLEQYMSKLGSI